MSAPLVSGWIRVRGSTRMTSAPHSDSNWVTYGPAHTTVTSATRMPSSGNEAIAILPPLLDDALGAELRQLSQLDPEFAE